MLGASKGVTKGQRNCAYMVMGDAELLLWTVNGIHNPKLSALISFTLLAKPVFQVLEQFSRVL